MALGREFANMDNELYRATYKLVLSHTHRQSYAAWTWDRNFQKTIITWFSMANYNQLVFHPKCLEISLSKS